MSNQSFLSQNIIKFREIKNLTQEQVAEKLGITRQTFAKMESGIKEPSNQQIIALSNLFEISLAALTSSKIDTILLGNKNILRDYIYINESKVNSYLNSLGINVETPKNHKTTQKKDEVKKQTNYIESLTPQMKTDKLVIALENNALFFDEPTIGGFYKINSELQKVETAQTFFNLLNFMEIYEKNTSTNFIEEQYKFIFQMVKEDLKKEMTKFKLTTNYQDYQFYFNLEEKYDPNIEYLYSSNTVICKVKEIIRKSNNRQPIIQFPSLAVLPKENYNQFIQSLITAGETMGQKVPFYYEEDSIVVEPVFIYQ